MLQQLRLVQHEEGPGSRPKKKSQTQTSIIQTIEGIGYKDNRFFFYAVSILF